MVLAVAPRVNEFLDASTKRWARCWKLVRKDGAIRRFTNHSNGIQIVTSFSPYTLETFSPQLFGVSRESSRTVVGGQPETDAVTGFISTDGWSPEDVRVGLYEGCRLDVYDVDWRYPFAGYFYHSRRYVQEVEWSGESITFRLASIAQKADVQTGRTYEIRCDVQRLGDSRCTKDISGLVSGTKTVTAVNPADGPPRSRFESNNTSQADDYWTDGLLTWLSGTNAINGVETQQVKRSIQTDGVMVLWTPTPYDIEVGDTFTVEPGCNRLFAQHCVAKFANGDNHRGFRFLAGFDKVLTGPNSTI